MDIERRRRYERAYGRDLTDAERAVELEVFGTEEGIWSYTTPAQAGELARLLELRAGSCILDIGAGRGWPSVYLSRTTGATVIATDVPAGSVRSSLRRAMTNRIIDRFTSLRASGTHLPFRARAFDAVIHTDVL